MPFISGGFGEGRPGYFTDQGSIIAEIFLPARFEFINHPGKLHRWFGKIFFPEPPRDWITQLGRENATGSR